MGEEEVHLTPTEYLILACLASQPGRLFSREELIRGVWNYEPDYQTYVNLRVQISNLRKDTISFNLWFDCTNNGNNTNWTFRNIPGAPTLSNINISRSSDNPRTFKLTNPSDGLG